MRFSDLNNRTKKQAGPVPPVREEKPPRARGAEGRSAGRRTAVPGKKPAEPLRPLDASVPDTPFDSGKTQGPVNAEPLKRAGEPGPSPAATPAKPGISRKDRQRKDEAAVRAVERPFQELDAEAREVYSRTVSLVKEFLSQVDQPYLEKYESLTGMAELNCHTLLDNPALLGCTAHGTADNYLYAHSANVAIISQAMGIAMGLEKSEVGFLGFCAMAHDIGMTEHAALVNTAARLTDEEYEKVTLHSEAGAAKLDRLLDMDYRLKERARKVILQVHERIDGSGYPDRRTNEEIDILAQIIGVADVYEAISHPRPWRPAGHPHTAIKHLIDKEGKGFSQKVIKAIIEVLSIYPPGSLVALTSGEIANVIKINKGSLTRPVVAVLLDGAFAPVAPRFIDLMAHPLTAIERVVEETELAARNPKFAARRELARWWVGW